MQKLCLHDNSPNHREIFQVCWLKIKEPVISPIFSPRIFSNSFSNNTNIMGICILSWDYLIRILPSLFPIYIVDSSDDRNFMSQEWIVPVWYMVFNISSCLQPVECRYVTHDFFKMWSHFLQYLEDTQRWIHSLQTIESCINRTLWERSLVKNYIFGLNHHRQFL